MSSKLYKLFNKLWFTIIEIVVAVAYAFVAYVRAANSIFELKNDWLSTVIAVVMLLFSIIVINKFVCDSNDKINRAIAFAYAIMIAVDTYVNDSLVGIIFIAILLMHLLIKVKNGYNSVAQLFLASVIGAEAASLLSMLDIFQTDSIMNQTIGYLWIDLLLVLAVVFYSVTKDKKQKKGWISRILLPNIVLAFDVACIAALSFGAYVRNDSYYVIAEQIEDGTSVYIMSSDDGGKALTCSNNLITISPIVNSDDQLFTFEESEEEGYWHIVADNTNVLDINAVLFEEGNTVIAWEENGVIGQHWTVNDIGINEVEINSYMPEYSLTWGEHVEEDQSVLLRTLITSNEDDNNRHFFLKNADAVNTPVIGWMVNGNRLEVVLAYIVMMILVTLSTFVVVVKRK